MVKNRYSVILPTYNEKDNLPIIIVMLINTFKQHNIDFEILVVEDNSPDGTAEVYKKLQKLYPEERLLMLQRPGKLGLGSAYIDGLAKTTGDHIILMDADFSHHPKFIPEFIQQQAQTGCEVVTGSRYIVGGGVSGWDLRRVFTSRVANYLASVLLNPGVSDLTGSFRLYKREVLEKVMPLMQSRGYVFQMEIVVRAKQLGYRVAEVPITFVDRIFGESKLGVNEIVGYLKGLGFLWWTL
eukprot:GDKI01025806.1.p1 GENE.GDKI01025806.1~~GDKI01025806.1.p1  ORF type:complete len:240 (-),score=91.03 GDKI01025806.1:171-890(-)